MEVGLLRTLIDNIYLFMNNFEVELLSTLIDNIYLFMNNFLESHFF